MPFVAQVVVMEAANAAIASLLMENPPLDFPFVHERTVAHRLAVGLEAQLADWNVDCEYNRDQDVYKMPEGIAACDEQRTTDRIFPDIIVHSRRNRGREHNLLVVELKRRAPVDTCDFRKLELFTQPERHYAYQYGLYINIDGGAFDCTWFIDGHRITSLLTVT